MSKFFETWGNKLLGLLIIGSFSGFCWVAHDYQNLINSRTEYQKVITAAQKEADKPLLSSLDY